MTAAVAGPAEHAYVGASFMAEARVGEVVNGQGPPETPAVLAAAERLDDPQPSAQSP